MAGRAAGLPVRRAPACGSKRLGFDVWGLAGQRDSGAPGLGVYSAWLGGLPGFLSGAALPAHLGFRACGSLHTARWAARPSCQAHVTLWVVAMGSCYARPGVPRMAVRQARGPVRRSLRSRCSQQEENFSMSGAACAFVHACPLLIACLVVTNDAGGWWWNRDDMTVRELDQMKSRELNNGRLAMCAGCSGSQRRAWNFAVQLQGPQSSASAFSGCSAVPCSFRQFA